MIVEAVLDSGALMAYVRGMAAKAGRIGAGHAALTAASHSVAVYTSLPQQIEAVLGKTGPIVEV